MQHIKKGLYTSEMYISPNDKLKVTLALWPAPKTITGITRFAVLAK